MLAIHVKLNGKRLTTAGAEDLGVLTSHVTLTGKLGSKTVEWRNSGRPDIWLRVGGLTSRAEGIGDDHLYLTDHKPLRVGDKITLRIVETSRAGRVVSRVTSRKKAPGASGQAFYKMVKEQYFKLRKVYEKRRSR